MQIEEIYEFIQEFWENTFRQQNHEKMQNAIMNFFYSFIYGCGNYVGCKTSSQFSVKPESFIHYKVL